MPNAPTTKVRLPEFMPFFWLGCAALVGPLLASRINLPWYAWGVAASLSVLGAILQARSRPRILPQPQLPSLLLAASVCFAALLYQVSLPGTGPDAIPYYLDMENLTLRGMVVKPPETRSTATALTVRLSTVESAELKTGEARVSGKILVEVPLGSVYHYGDEVQIHGELTVPEDFGSFSYRAWLEHHGIYALARYAQVRVLATGNGSPILTAIYQLREKAIGVVNAIFPSPESALLRGILLGDESGISSGLKYAYSLTGTAHIIAISGFNMTILASIVTRLLTKRFGARSGGVVAILVLAGYSILVGASASVIRAAIMSSYVILGSMLFRRGNMLNNLGLCVLLMVWIDPHIPWDIGFQMSAMATLGLAMFSEPWQKSLRARLEARFGEPAAEKLGGVLGEYFLLTLIAQAMVLPLIIWHFRESSWLFLLANPLVLPVQPPLMILSLVALAGGLLAPGLGKLLAWLAWPFSAYTNRVVLFLSGLFPNAWVFPAFSQMWVLLYYALFFAVAFRLAPRKAAATLLKPAWALTGLTCLSLLVWSAVEARPDGRLTLRLIGAEADPVALVTTAGGAHILINGAMDGRTLLQEVTAAFSPFNRQIDFIIIPSCSKAAVSGLFGLTNSMRVGQVLWGCDASRLATTRNLSHAFEQQGIPQANLRAQDVIAFGQSGLLQAVPGEKALSALSLQLEEFKAVLSYAADIQPCELSLASVFIGPGLPKSGQAPCQRQTNPVLILGSPSPGDVAISAYQPISLADYRWVEVSTDGSNFSLRGRK